MHHTVQKSHSASPQKGYETPEWCREDPEAGAAMLELADYDPEAVTGPMVAEAALAGDAAAVGLYAGVGRWLGEGIAGLVNMGSEPSLGHPPLV